MLSLYVLSVNEDGVQQLRTLVTIGEYALGLYSGVNDDELDLSNKTHLSYIDNCEYTFLTLLAGYMMRIFTKKTVHGEKLPFIRI